MPTVPLLEHRVCLAIAQAIPKFIWRRANSRANSSPIPDDAPVIQAVAMRWIPVLTLFFIKLHIFYPPLGEPSNIARIARQAGWRNKAIALVAGDSAKDGGQNAVASSLSTSPESGDDLQPSNRGEPGINSPFNNLNSTI
ncbi:hypothetical protein [Phormidium sp. CCY1219]|uniref:hypothetical protein n=1 Tax=Phormidium sp. CCY1219 TaxID=2886104 RepID=UPI002D1E9F99|nr:hypothetical protein [Phormidium sp. CCY1219]MEB3827495.1 hypothetical protein [Phormidium sp. CCY1219]